MIINVIITNKYFKNKENMDEVISKENVVISSLNVVINVVIPNKCF